jgi:outer membrane receptor protein involved in Fe transport
MMASKLLLQTGISMLALASPAMAQETSDKEERDPGIVVTGTRITATGDNLPTPVTVATPEVLLRTSPTNIPDGLNKLPIFALSRGTANLNNPTDNFTGNYLNLRGFGIQRNLILLDGHRVAPTSYTGAVDTNVLPQLLLQRVDVVTGGASAVYGSDAISGVVNFIVDKNFVGIKAEAQSGISGHGDARSWRAAAAYGTSFAGGRGHFLASYEHFQQNGIDKEDRDNGRKVYAIAGAGSAANPYRLITGARNIQIAFQGNIYTGPLAGQIFRSPGIPGAPVFGTREGDASSTLYSGGGDGFYGKQSSATADLKTDQAYARLDYDLTDGVNFYVQGIFAKNKTFNKFYPNLFFPMLVGTDNAFLPPATQAAIGGPAFLFARVFDDPSHALGVKSDGETWMASGGFDGSTGGFDWNLHYQHGVNTTYNYQVNNTIFGNTYAALDAVDQGQFTTGTPNGNIVCRVTLTNPSAYPGCVPLNAFGASPASQQAALHYVFGDSYNRPRFTMDNVQASVSGTAFDNWAGPVRFAVSGEYRRVKLDVSTNAPTGLFADCTGIRFNCVPGATSYYRDAQITPISVREDVKEAALEVDFPLLKDSGFGTLNLSGAVRYTDYSTSGGVTTWKVGGDWQIFDDLRLRATRSRDIRAPSLYDRYQPQTRAQSGYQDLHTGFSGIIPTETGGNADLVPEVAQTLTFGAVYRPTALPNFSVAVDYYRISIDNAISLVDGRVQAIQKLCEDSGGTSIFCGLYDRPLPFSNTTSANAPSLVRLTTLNASSVKTWGIDAEINYAFSVGNEGRVSLRGLAGYQPQLTTVLVPGATPQYGAGAAATQSTGGVPKLRLTAFVSYSNPNWGIDIQERWRSSLKWDADRTIQFAIPDVPSVAYTDLTLTAFVDRDKGKQLFFSVQNLFDKQPPVYLTAGTSGTPAFSFPAVSGDDILGRYFTVGARFKF